MLPAVDAQRYLVERRSLAGGAAQNGHAVQFKEKRHWNMLAKKQLGGLGALPAAVNKKEVKTEALTSRGGWGIAKTNPRADQQSSFAWTALPLANGTPASAVGD